MTFVFILVVVKTTDLSFLYFTSVGFTFNGNAIAPEMNNLGTRAPYETITLIPKKAMTSFSRTWWR